MKRRLWVVEGNLLGEWEPYRAQVYYTREEARKWARGFIGVVRVVPYIPEPKRGEAMNRHIIEDYEVTRVRMTGGRDLLGKARVWICEPYADGGPEEWTVYHRPSIDSAFPVLIASATTFEDALGIARALALVYDAELAREKEKV